MGHAAPSFSAPSSVWFWSFEKWKVSGELTHGIYFVLRHQTLDECLFGRCKFFFVLVNMLSFLNRMCPNVHLKFDAYSFFAAKTKNCASKCLVCHSPRKWRN